MKDILEKIAAERARQDAKWGADRKHHPIEWLAILAEEFGEVSKEVVEYNFQPAPGIRRNNLLHLRMELIQVAAVAVAFVECLDKHTIPQAEKELK